MDIKTLSAIIGHNSAETTLNIYTHITEKMQKSAAEKIGQNLGRNASLSGEDNKVIDKTIKTSCRPKFEPVKNKRRKSGTGCITEINDHLYEGGYLPKLPNGKQIAKNVYAKTREECEIKLAELIKVMKAEIKNQKV